MPQSEGVDCRGGLGDGLPSRMTGACPSPECRDTARLHFALSFQIRKHISVDMGSRGSPFLKVSDLWGELLCVSFPTWSHGLGMWSSSVDTGGRAVPGSLSSSVALGLTVSRLRPIVGDSALVTQLPGAAVLCVGHTWTRGLQDRSVRDYVALGVNWSARARSSCLLLRPPGGLRLPRTAGQAQTAR